MSRTLFGRFGLMALLFMCTLTACENIDVDDESVPFAITNFIDQYFAGRGYSDVESISDTDYRFTINNGPTVTVKVLNDSQYNPQVELLVYQGNGETMPQQMAWDFFPEKLYDYIDGLESLNYIYEYTLDSAKKIMTVQLQDTKVVYYISTEKIEEI